MTNADHADIVKNHNAATELAALAGIEAWAGCPCCGKVADNYWATEADFGFRRCKRTLKDGSTRITTRVQSHCRDCRRKEAAARRAGQKVTHRAWLLK